MGCALCLCTNPAFAPPAAHHLRTTYKAVYKVNVKSSIKAPGVRMPPRLRWW
jgi:hypothetical protein